MSSVCSQCGGTDIEYDQARGDAVCTSCGSVLEDNIIVSEITFQEQSSGASTVVGQFVSSEGAKNPLSGTGFHHGMGKNSREVTLQQAKKRLTNLGNLLKLNHHCIDSAFMFFKMALNRNLTRGRKSSIVDTACLYLVCRSEGTPHLLLDFSDVLQINVYALGRAYLKLANALHINPPAIDPCLYIHRFAHKLELQEKTHDVSVTAMRLVARMKRDWIHHGRRPAGLCGAALLVAARLHNFNRSVREVAKVVKLSEGTIRKRLGDFKDTASSRLTIDEFLKIDLEQEHDPPSFNDAKKKSKLQQQQTESGSECEEEEDGEVVKSKGGEEVDEEEEGEAGVRSGGGGGFGGIVIGSVEETIERARIAEAFMNASTAAGLSDNLDSLATLVDQEDDGAEAGERPEESELNLEGIDDREIDMMLLSEEEAKIKAQLWYSENADFLKEQEIKKEKLAAQEAARADKPKKKYNKRKNRISQPASTAGEAIERMLVERKISTKINYDVLKDLDKTVSAQADTSQQPTLVEEASTSNRHSVAGVASEGGVGEGGDETTAGFSGWGSPPLMAPRAPLVSGRRDRLPSLQSRKRSLPSFATAAALPPKLPRLQNITVEPLPASHHVLDSSSQLSPSNSKQTTPIDHRPSLATTSSLHGGNERGGDLVDGEVGEDLVGGEVGEDLVGGEVGEDLVGGEEGEGGSGVGEVVEESGPVVYSDGEEEEEGGFGDADMDELAYEGDPLLYSDGEEAGDEYYD